MYCIGTVCEGPHFAPGWRSIGKAAGNDRYMGQLGLGARIRRFMLRPAWGFLRLGLTGKEGNDVANAYGLFTDPKGSSDIDRGEEGRRGVRCIYCICVPEPARCP